MKKKVSINDTRKTKINNRNSVINRNTTRSGESSIVITEEKKVKYGTQKMFYPIRKL